MNENAYCSIKGGGGGGAMLFHAFRAVYPVKELDSHAKHRKKKKIQLDV